MTREEAFAIMRRMVETAQAQPDGQVVVVSKSSTCELATWGHTLSSAEFIAVVAAADLETRHAGCDDCDGARFMRGVLALYRTLGGIIQSASDEPQGRA